MIDAITNELENLRAQKHGLFLIIVFGLLFVPAFTIFTGSPIRFIFYLFPGLSILYWLFSSPSYNLVVNSRYVLAIFLYSILIFIGALLSIDTIDTKTWIDGLKPLFYLAAFVPAMIFNHKSVKYLTIVFLFATIFLALFGGGTTRGELDFEQSQGPLESGLAFPLGGILIYFLLKKEKFWAFLTFILFFLAFKRVAFAAVLIVFFLILLNRFISKLFGLSKYKLAWLSLSVIVISASLINIFYFEFFNWLLAATSSEKTIVEATMGRSNEFEILYYQYGEQPLINLLFGNGPGDATRKLVEITINYPLQVHNSFLLYFYEYGVIGFGLLLASFLVVFSRNSFGLYLFAYNIIIMVTDNTFIHHYHQIAYFILIAATQYELDQKQELSIKNHD